MKLNEMRMLTKDEIIEIWNELFPKVTKHLTRLPNTEITLVVHETDEEISEQFPENGGIKDNFLAFTGYIIRMVQTIDTSSPYQAYEYITTNKSVRFYAETQNTVYILSHKIRDAVCTILEQMNFNIDEELYLLLQKMIIQFCMIHELAHIEDYNISIYSYNDLTEEIEGDTLVAFTFSEKAMENIEKYIIYRTRKLVDIIIEDENPYIDKLYEIMNEIQFSRCMECYNEGKYNRITNKHIKKLKNHIEK